MHNRRQNTDSEFTLDVRSVARQAALHCQKRLATQNDCVPQEEPILLAEISELGFVEPRAEGLAFGRRTVALKADLRMISDIPEPLHVARLALVVRLLQACVRDNPFELCALVDQENVAERLNVRDAFRNSVDAIGSGDRLTLIDVAAVLSKRLCGAGIQKNAAR